MALVDAFKEKVPVPVRTETLTIAVLFTWLAVTLRGQ
jgi:hypothetical protein